MPFIRESIDTLMKREGLSFRMLAKDLSAFAQSKGAKDNFSPSSLHAWSKGSKTPTFQHLDLIYEYARNKGYTDLEFYRPPSNEEHS